MVKVQLRAREPGLHGIIESATGPRLKIAVAEAAEDGKANRAVCALLAKALDRPPSSISILTGASNREKVLAVAGDSAALEAMLRAL